MDLKAHYNRLYETSVKKISEGNYTIDKLIYSAQDKRLGITLIIRPPEEITNRIQHVLDEFKDLEPNQYYYKSPDIHITVMSIISCYEGFLLQKINVSEYIKIIAASIIDIKPFQIHFKGLTASSSCIMVQGFINNPELNRLRNNLRLNFKKSGLEQSIDSRYTIETAHSTIVRFSKYLNNASLFLDRLQKFRDFDFGKFQPKSLELVYNDWYLREKLVKNLYDFKI